MENITFQCAKTLYDLKQMDENIYMEHLAQEMARQRTLKWINRI